MITGIGIDSIEVERMREKMERAAGFREMVFATSEITYCETKTHKYQHYAARFAAKEAFYKAIGTGWLIGTAFNEIVINHEEKGKPFIVLNGATADLYQKFAIEKIHVSLTHLQQIATAIVIIESNEF